MAGSDDQLARAGGFLNESEVERLLEGAKKGRDGVRDHLLLMMIYRHGLRVSEAIGLARQGEPSACPQMGRAPQELAVGRAPDRRPLTGSIRCFHLSRCACAGARMKDCNVMTGRRARIAWREQSTRPVPHLQTGTLAFRFALELGDQLTPGRDQIGRPRTSSMLAAGVQPRSKCITATTTGALCFRCHPKVVPPEPARLFALPLPVAAMFDPKTVL